MYLRNMSDIMGLGRGWSRRLVPWGTGGYLTRCKEIGELQSERGLVPFLCLNLVYIKRKVPFIHLFLESSLARMLTCRFTYRHEFVSLNAI